MMESIGRLLQCKLPNDIALAPTELIAFQMAGDFGFEPKQKLSESFVLPDYTNLQWLGQIELDDHLRGQSSRHYHYAIPQ